jgi:translation initiation factor 4G
MPAIPHLTMAQVGRLITSDPAEEKAQKALKALLNKITPQNFEKISKQIIEEIQQRNKAVTLQGFIDQIFDKALIETTFSELYAELVDRQGVHLIACSAIIQRLLP